MTELTPAEQEARKRVCLPLDNLGTLDEVRARVEALSGHVGLFKVGKGSYTRFGPEVVRMVQEAGADVFLDLKYHDIPNTVEDAAQAAAELGVYMFNVHASGGFEMMQAAYRGAQAGAKASENEMPKVIGVTVLTSLDDVRYLETLGGVNKGHTKFDFGGYRGNESDDEVRTAIGQNGFGNVIEDQVLHLAKLTHQAGLDGIVCSAADVGGIKDQLPDGFMYVTPGVKRPGTTGAGSDQQRVATPGNAIQDGSSILVVGRAITDPRTAEQKASGMQITQEMQQQAAYQVLTDMAPYTG
jgi:orotidine-5'-phosphate decarboxylase